MAKAKAADRIKKELQNELSGIVLIALSFFITFCLWYGKGSNNISAIGAIGGFIYRVVTAAFGTGKYLLPFFIFLIGVSKLWFRVVMDKLTWISWLALYFSVLAVDHIMLPLSEPTFKAALSSGWAGEGGGICGALVSSLTLTLLGRIGSFIFLGTIIIISFVGILKKPLKSIISQITHGFAQLLAKTKQEIADFILEDIAESEDGEAVPSIPRSPAKSKEAAMPAPVIIDHTLDNAPAQAAPVESPEFVKTTLRLVSDKETPSKKEPGHTATFNPATGGNNFVLPTTDLLQFPTKIKSQRMNKDITDKVRILEETLENFGVKARVTQVSRGPSITRYEIQPPPGIKVSRIVGLADDIALSLAVPQVRIEAPIPGKAAVGVEVPNEEIASVTLREVLETELFQNSSSKLTVALGKDIAGKPIVADLAKMPHLLIAGATGSGKSVCINAIIASVLFKANPDEVKLLMVDPKVVELSNFNGIPHLISQVVTDPKKAATSLRWVVHEMENRYEIFAGLGVKDIFRYNQIKREGENTALSPMPFIIVLIDELADLMMVAPADVEDAICRLAQMARATGMHLVLATQRPSVDVITGLIKANIPSRIAFAVSSVTDSRTILDSGGAERLLGRGDMLYSPVGVLKPRRIQGALVEEDEVRKVVEFWRAQSQEDQKTVAEFPAQVKEDERDPAAEDDLFWDAVKVVVDFKQASASVLQRRLRIGYSRAARLVDLMEARGFVGPFEGSKPREVKITAEQLAAMREN